MTQYPTVLDGEKGRRGLAGVSQILFRRHCPSREDIRGR
jgi:hypothetical protein